MQTLRQTLHRGDQTEIQYSAQRTPKSGRTKTSQEIRTHRNCGNRLQYYAPAQVGETDASWRLGKCLKSTEL